MFPEAYDERILNAVIKISKEGTAEPVLLGEREVIGKKANEINLKIDWGKIEVINPKTDERTEKFAQLYHKLHPSMDLEGAKDAMQNDPNTFGTMLVHQEIVDGMISGAISTTAETLRPALHIIGTKEKFHKVS
ncbi:MAG: phosphate acyltransferase, partial [Candidatus Peregrinibacteria bacterium]|nr:phosphate acyltransferase [Candidatus Peregrinibacteria bacterium]